MIGLAKKAVRRLSALAVLFAVMPAGTLAQSNAWQMQQLQRQQQMQAQQQRQQQMQAQQAQMQARQAQMQAQQARQQQLMQQQQRQQQAMQQQMQRQNQQQANVQQQRSGGLSANNSAAAIRRDEFNQKRGVIARSAPIGEIRGAAGRNVGVVEQRGFVSQGGITKLTRTLTAAEAKKGFTGKVTGDGRALIRFQGRIFAVPASTISGLVRPAANQNAAAVGSRTTTQKQVLSARMASLVNGQTAGRPANQNAAASGTRTPSPKQQALNSRVASLVNERVVGSPASNGRSGNGSGGGNLPPYRLGVPANENRTVANQTRLKGTWASVTANRVNAELRNLGYLQPPFTAGSKVYAVKTSQPEEFVRLYGDKSGPVGRFVARRQDIAGMTPERIKQVLALDYVPVHMIPVTLPENTMLYTGDASEQNDWSVSGGGRQYFLPEPINVAGFDESKRVDLIPGRPIY